jgi:hypothetical protein
MSIFLDISTYQLEYIIKTIKNIFVILDKFWQIFFQFDLQIFGNLRQTVAVTQKILN